MDFVKSTKFALSLTVVSAITFLILIFTTDPQSARLLGVLAVIISLYGAFMGIILLIGHTIIRRKKKVNRKRNLPLRESQSKQLGISAVLALAPVLIIVMNSLGSIGVIELALIAVFEFVVIFLIRKRN